MLSTSCAETPVLGGMSPQLRSLPLPQLVQNRESRKLEERIVGLEGCDLTYVYYTTNSSSSDVASPATPTFSPRGHLRYSSSASSLELAPLPQEGPTSPTQHATSTKSSVRQLPDVLEEPLERDDQLSDSFGLYSCLCDHACEHSNSSDDILHSGDMTSEFDIDYDLGFLSDGDFTTDPRYPKKKWANGAESTFTALTSRLGSRFPGITRWKSGRRSNIMASPTTELSLENVLSGAPSSRSSSMSAPSRQFPDRLQEVHMPPNPAMPFYERTDSPDMHSGLEINQEERSSIQRDRSMATTPLLPPLMTDPLGKPPPRSPLQSPSIAPLSAVTEMHSPRLPPAHYSKPSLSTRPPSLSSLRQTPVMAELPLPLPPSILQEQDEWSDRLGHANFTIAPMPYELQAINGETVTKFRDDWDAARVNYTKHLVRTGENYGQTSKIYALTEAKWAEIERRWRAIYEDIIRQTEPAAPAMMASRSRSRGRGRGRSESLSTANKGLLSHDDVLAAVHWRRMEDCLPSAVPQMLEALDAEGKFPGRGDEDIVGPMQRDAFMARARSEEAKNPRFWRNLAEKLRR